MRDDHVSLGRHRGATPGRKLLCPCLVLTACLLAVACSSEGGDDPDRHVMALGVTSDGEHVVSSHFTEAVRVWNMADRRSRQIASDANIYSAAAAGADHVVWQDHSGTVHVNTAQGKFVKKFAAPPSKVHATSAYSHAIGKDLDTYVMTDGAWRLWHRAGGDAELVKEGDKRSFAGYGKPLNVELAAYQPIALTSGFGGPRQNDGLAPGQHADSKYAAYSGVTVWSLKSHKPIHNLKGNSAKTHATLSPDSEHVVAVDENGKAFRWKISTGQRQRLSSLGSGVFVPSEGDELGDYDASGLHLDDESDFPEDFEKGSYIGVHFVSPRHYIILRHNSPYAPVYKLGDPYALEIVDLGTDPFPSVARYSRNEAVDSSPEANLLVTGQRSGGSINVYRFDPETLTLNKIWAPSLD